MPAAQRKPSRYTEVERKFAVVEGTVTPSFEGLSSVARVERTPVQHLEAVYFDTPNQDLTAHRVTLRRRTGGPDAGWHLKLPAGTDSRTEVRIPLGEAGGPDDSVPEELRDVVLAIVRDRPLSPVARISTNRVVDVLHGPEGTPLAEFCDDAVTGSAESGGEPQQWREWELELAEGVDSESGSDLLDRLANRLFDAGARPAKHGSKLARVLATTSAEPAPQSEDIVHRAVTQQIAELLVWDRAVRADAWDSVHQMRVTTRRIRSLMKGSEDSFGLDDDSSVLDELRQLAGVLGVARDAEVLAERYARTLDELPAELVRGPVRDRLVEGANLRYQAGLRRSLTAMRSERYFRLLDALDALTSAEPVPSPSGQPPRQTTVASAYEKLRKAAKAATVAAASPDASDEHHDEALHRIRKKAKQLRYTAAATAANKIADRAKTIQTLLGDHHDSVVSRANLSEAVAAAHAADEDTFTYGLLYQREDELARRSEEQLAGAMKKLKKSVRDAK